MVVSESLPAGKQNADYRRCRSYIQCPSQYGKALACPEATEELSYWPAGGASVSTGGRGAFPQQEIYADAIKKRLCATTLNSLSSNGVSLTTPESSSSQGNGSQQLTRTK